MHKILVIRLCFPLYALHVSDCISPSSGEHFISCTSHLVPNVWLLCGYSHTPAHTKCDVQLIKVAPDDELI